MLAIHHPPPQGVWPTNGHLVVSRLRSPWTAVALPSKSEPLNVPETLLPIFLRDPIRKSRAVYEPDAALPAPGPTLCFQKTTFSHPRTPSWLWASNLMSPTSKPRQ